VLTALREIVQYRSLLRNLVARDLKVRYRRSVLGVVWTMLNPLLMMIVITVVFAEILRIPREHFNVYFLSAFLIWNFFAQTTAWSTACFQGYAPLIKKIYVPKAIFVLATVVSGLVNLVISLVPLALIMLFVGHPFSKSLVFIPLPILLIAVFSLGVSLLLAPICIVFADVRQLYEVVLPMWMYLTPVIYPMDMVPDAYRGLVNANPMTYFVEAFRAPVYAGQLPPASLIVASTLFAFAALAIGSGVFARYSNRVAYLV
jgi:ABC-type polysaccharide/polyol phosphate export permease